jgi:MFS family permease
MNATASSAPPLTPKLNLQLSVMMFLQYAIWGAWLPIFFPFLTVYRGFTGDQAGTLFAVGAIGAVVAPFIAGQIADRYFNTEKYLGVSHILGGLLVWQLATVESYNGLMVFGILYALLYVPTLGLSNALAFHHLPDRDRDFGKVRVWGTVGWIAVGIGIGQFLAFTATPPKPEAEKVAVERLKTMDPKVKAETLEVAIKGKKDPTDAEKEAALLEAVAKRVILEKQAAGMAVAFKVSAALGWLLGVFCFTLPKTPPKKSDQAFAPFAAIGQIKKMPLLALFILSFPLSVVHQFYFVRTAGFLGTLQSGATAAIDKVIAGIFGVGGGGLMTIGQIAEIAVLAFMPVLAKKFSRKMLLGIGVAAYTLRFLVFAYVPVTAAVVPALALHGLCFGCFFFVAFMIVDEETTPDVRASAQNLYNFIIMALGVIFGNLFAGKVDVWATKGAVTDYATLFGIPAGICLACFVALFALYPSKARAEGAKAA